MAKKKDKDAAEDGEEVKGGGKKKIIIAAVLVLALAGGGWFFFLRGGDAEPAALPAPVPGEVLPLDPITVNLAGGHFLQVGMALQVIEGPAHEPDGSKALDLAIALFSGKTVAELSTVEGRSKAKEELVARIKLAYAPHEEGAEEEHAAEEGTEEEGAEEEGAEEGSEEEAAADETGHAEVLTAEEAIEEASKLTVQPEIYDVYFTEFVMR